MSAPEKIWVNLDDNTDGCCPVETDLDDVGKFFDASQATEYTRSDLIQSAVAAALEAAAGEAQMHADHWRKAWETAKSNSSPKEARDWQTMMLGGLFVKDSIRALINPAQHDALAAHVAAEVAKARAEDASEIAQLEQDLDDMRDNAESAYRRGYFEGRNGA